MAFMQMHSVIAALRIGLALMFAAVMIAAPIAEANHTEAVPEIVCEQTGHDNLEQSAPANEHDHEHHRHNCGSCHVHILARDNVPPVSEPYSPSTRYQLTAETLVNGAAPSLFRPPRA